MSTLSASPQHAPDVWRYPNVVQPPRHLDVAVSSPPPLPRRDRGPCTACPTHRRSNGSRWSRRAGRRWPWRRRGRARSRAGPAVRAFEARKNRENSSACSSSGMPIPVSADLHLPAAGAVATMTVAVVTSTAVAVTAATERHGAHSDATLGRRELDRVRQQVLEELRQAGRRRPERRPVDDVDSTVDGPGGRVGSDVRSAWRTVGARPPTTRRAGRRATPGCRGRPGRRRAAAAGRRCGRWPRDTRPARSRRRRRRRPRSSMFREELRCSRRSTSTACGARGRRRRATRSGRRPSRPAGGSPRARRPAAAPARPPPSAWSVTSRYVERWPRKVSLTYIGTKSHSSVRPS